MSDFAALSVGLSGLEASKEALDLVGQNVTNANTPGYVQERLDQSAVGGIQFPGFNQPTTPDPGSGVVVTGVERLGDLFLQAQSLAQQGAAGSLTAQQSALTQVQQAFPEPSTNGISALFTNFFNAWDNISSQSTSTDPSARTAVLTAGSTLASALNNASSAIAAVSASSGQQLTSSVATVNSLAGQIASLNHLISAGTTANLPVGALQDQRDQLVSTLSSQLGVTVQSNADGSINLYAGNEALVAGQNAQQLSVSGAGSGTTLTWSADGSTLHSASGQIGGLMSVLTSSLPAQSSALDGVASNLIAAVNNLQTSGVTPTGTAGTAFFTGTGAGNIAVALTDQTQIASASASSPTPPAGSLNTDGSNAAAIGQLATATTVALSGGSTITGPVSSYGTMITNLGGVVSNLNSQVTTQSQAVTAANAAYVNATGVNTDEQLSKMVQYQNSYAASAKYISAISSTLSTLLGMVN